QLARRHEGQLQPRMGRHQPDQIGAGMPARTDDAKGETLLAHVFASRRNRRWLRAAGNSASMMEDSTVSRRVPSVWRLWLRSTPSWRAPRRVMAAREAWLCQLVSKPTLAQPSTSKAWPSSISLHSVLSPVRCTRGAY